MPGSISTVAFSARDRIRREFQNAPLGTSVAVITIAALLWQWISNGFGDHLALTNPPDHAEQLKSGLPAIAPYLEFLISQIAIAYLLHWLNSLFSGANTSFKISIGLLTTVVAAYLTELNAFQITRFMIEARHSHYDVFIFFTTVGIALTVVLITALRIDHISEPVDAAKLLNIASTVMPIAILMYCLSFLFEGEFVDRLHPIWVAAQNAALKW